MEGFEGYSDKKSWKFRCFYGTAFLILDLDVREQLQRAGILLDYCFLLLKGFHQSAYEFGYSSIDLKVQIRDFPKILVFLGSRFSRVFDLMV